MSRNNNIQVRELRQDWDKTKALPDSYTESMPDLQNGLYNPTYQINHVGCHNFHAPLRVLRRDGGWQEVVATITGTVSLEADKKGINMSRIFRTFTKNMEDTFSIDRLCRLLQEYKKELNSFNSHINIHFPYRIWQPALSTPNEGGWQYYDIGFDIDLNENGEFYKVMSVKFVYSSACPCSTALSEHAAYEMGEYGIPHSQRSVMDIQVVFDKVVWIEDIVNLAQQILVTETQVFVKRQDEGYFALLNGSHTKFVEDAVRLIADGLMKIPDKVKDFRLVASHMESLHSHNAIAILTKGIPGSRFSNYVSHEELDALIR